MNSRSRIYSAVGTALVVALVVAWMMLDTISLGDADKEWPPKHDSEIVIDDEYAELLDLPKPKSPKIADPTPAYNETIENNLAEAAPQTGMEVVDQGQPGDAPETVTQTQPSTVKVEKKPQPKPQGPSAEELKKQKEEAEARRKATSQTQNAFRNAGKNNADNRAKTEGDAGRPTGSVAAVNGRGTGRVGGGWALPRYNDVPSTVTGSVEMMVKIDRNGKVKSVSFQGGDAPAVTDPKVRAACEREVRSRNFTRSDDNAPEESTAYVTYRFR